MSKATTTLRIHTTLAGSLSNGPKRSFVVWVQGCTLKCPGCCNPGMHDPAGGREVTVDSLVQDIVKDGTIEGLTVSGGEPLEQVEAVLELVTKVRTCRPEFCIVLFTGFELADFAFVEVCRQMLSSEHPHSRYQAMLDLFQLIDVAVEGRYIRERPGKDPLVASSNQRVWFPTGRFGPDDLRDIPRVEYFINEDGDVIETGVAVGRRVL